MLHPLARIKWFGDSKGYGLYATSLIPKGTIIYVADALEIVLDESDPLLTDPRYLPIIERYSYLTGNGDRILSWDAAKYMNHCCDANSLTTGYGFEIAVRDIAAGEEITDDYGVFTVEHQMKISCRKSDLCRRRVCSQDFDELVEGWDEKIKDAMASFNEDQPLWPFVEKSVQKLVKKYLKTGRNYISVAVQRPYSRARSLTNSGILLADFTK